MKQKATILVLAMSLLLSGCGVFNQSYISVEPHREQRQTVQTDVIMASNYLELLGALEKLGGQNSRRGAWRNLRIYGS